MIIITHLNFGREERGNRVHNLAASHQVEKGEKKIKMTRILAFEVVTHVCICFYERYFKRDDISSLRNKPSGWSLEIHMICGDSCEKSREHSTKKFKATHHAFLLETSRVSGEINFLSFLALHSGINYYLLRHSSNSWRAKRVIASLNPRCENMFSVCNIFFLRTVKFCFAKWEFLF